MDDLLTSKEKIHVHKWRSVLMFIAERGPEKVPNYSGMICNCGATLTQKQVEEYVNRWQQSLQGIFWESQLSPKKPDNE